MTKKNKNKNKIPQSNISTKESKETLRNTCNSVTSKDCTVKAPQEQLEQKVEDIAVSSVASNLDDKVNPNKTEEAQNKETANTNQEDRVDKHDILELTNKYMSLNVPKKTNKGEDSDPLVVHNGNICYVGVFDGMGGSGATEYSTANGTHTGAYIASREVKKVCEEYLKKNKEVNVSVLKENIKKRLDDCLKIYNIRPSGLRSSIIRILPTTLAIVSAEKKDRVTKIRSYWCGDSRNYILTKSGLQQISIDDLSKPQDPLENLRNDEALSNCISQDKTFSIHEHDCGELEEPIIIISATDGCFGYLSTPMHFEYLLLKTMASATDCNQWKQLIEKELIKYSGDDFSLALIMVDESFDFWKKELANRLKLIEETYIDQIQKMKDNIIEAEKLLETSKTDLYNGITSLWENYKTDFLKIK